MSDNNCECPVCGKHFNVGSIESHVDKCLFLNATGCSQETTKRKATIEPLTNENDNEKRQKTDDTSSPSFQASSDSSDSDVVFIKQVEMSNRNKPLAEEVRPMNFEDYVGQSVATGPHSILQRLIQINQIPNMIFWGPPGCGKTTLANIIQKKCLAGNSYRFFKKSATNTGVSDVKSLIEATLAENKKNHSKRRTVLFLDEIHRFNKSQQDVLLPYLENGDIVLIGATTENPSFSLNTSLLSRCKLFIFQKLEIEDVKSILLRAAKLKGISVVGGAQINDVKEEKSDSTTIELKAIDWLAEMCDGDARIALTGLEMALNQCVALNTKNIELKDIKDGVKRSHSFFERKGEEHYNLISALHKAIRACDDNGALYWLARLLEGGEDHLFIARRLVRAASEDIGMVDHMALSLAVSAMHACEHLGMPDSEMVLAELVVYLARTDKSNEVVHALAAARSTVKNQKGPLPPVPLHLRNASNKFTSKLGYGRGYNKLHRDFSNITYMPPGLECMNFFKERPEDT